MRERIEAALTAFKAHRALVDKTIAELEKMLGKQGGSSTIARSQARPNAPRGLLRKRVHEILKHQKKPMAPVDLCRAVMKTGYPNKNQHTLYASLFALAKNDKKLRKSKEGFSLRR